MKGRNRVNRNATTGSGDTEVPLESYLIMEKMALEPFLVSYAALRLTREEFFSLTHSGLSYDRLVCLTDDSEFQKTKIVLLILFFEDEL